MKVAAIQCKPFTGDIEANKKRHLEFIEIAIKAAADLIYFPELSITGYEPRLAKSLATNPEVSFFDDFQNLSDIHQVIIGVGVPLKLRDQIQIGMVWFESGKPRNTYKKQILHSDEIPFFQPGDEQLVLQLGTYRIAPAICYESLQTSHADFAAAKGVNVYLTSVAKPSGGIKKAMAHYPNVASKNNMSVVMANCIGPCDDFISSGNSAAWDSQGKLIGKMDRESEGILMVDLEKGSTVELRD